MNVPLTKGQVTHVSLEDYKFLTRRKWYAAKTQSGYYAACRSQSNPHTMMHRIVAGRMGLDLSCEIDHLDGDSLNNRRSNLRVATVAQNGWNRGKPSNNTSNNTSGYKGVCWHKLCKKWVVQIQANGKRKHLGYFDNIEEAAKAYEKAAKKLHGEFAKC